VRRGVSKRRVSASANSQRYVCFASCFGATLSTILDFSGIAINKKIETVNALHEIIQFLCPIAENIDTIGGDDQRQLFNGLATNRVSKKQSKNMTECTNLSKTSYFYRAGLKDVTIGVTAAVLVAHHVMSAVGEDAQTIHQSLDRCVENSSNILKNWNLSNMRGDEMHRAALHSELRALERTKAASMAAHRVARHAGLDHSSAFHLQMSYMRSAAWPRNVSCDDYYHTYLLKQIEDGEHIGGTMSNHKSPITCAIASTPILHTLCCGGSSTSDCSGESDLSSLATLSTASSIASDDTYEVDDSFYCRESLVLAVERMRTTT